MKTVTCLDGTIGVADSPWLRVADTAMRVLAASPGMRTRVLNRSLLTWTPPSRLLPDVDWDMRPGPDDWMWVRSHRGLWDHDPSMFESGALMARALHGEGMSAGGAMRLVWSYVYAGCVARAHPVEFRLAVSEHAPRLLPLLGPGPCFPLCGWWSCLPVDGRVMCAVADRLQVDDRDARYAVDVSSGERVVIRSDVWARVPRVDGLPDGF